jgi:hypothetical protein
MSNQPRLALAIALVAVLVLSSAVTAGRWMRYQSEDGTEVGRGVVRFGSISTGETPRHAVCLVSSYTLFERGAVREDILETMLLYLHPDDRPASFRHELETGGDRRLVAGRFEQGICELAVTEGTQTTTVRQEIPAGTVFAREDIALGAPGPIGEQHALRRPVYFPRLVAVGWVTERRVAPTEASEPPPLALQPEPWRIELVWSVDLVESLSRRLWVESDGLVRHLSASRPGRPFLTIFEDQPPADLGARHLRPVLSHFPVFSRGGLPEGAAEALELMARREPGRLALGLTGTPHQQTIQQDNGAVLLRLTAFDFPANRANSSAEKPARFLQSSPLVNSAETALADRARRLAADANGVHATICTSAVTWIRRNISVVRQPGEIPTARAAFFNRESNALGRVLLLTALLRAAGVPARIVLGLEYDREAEVFFPSAYAETWLGEWLPLSLDGPETPHLPATVLKLVEVDPDEERPDRLEQRFFELLPHLNLTPVEPPAPTAAL